MTYLTFLNTIVSGFTYLTTTGVTNVIYIQKTLQDLIELDPKSYPGTSQTGKSVWIVPTPMSIDSFNNISYSARIYIAQQIREDRADQIDAISDCIQTAKALLQWLPATVVPIYAVNITPVLLFDAVVEGIYFDLTIRDYIECLI